MGTISPSITENMNKIWAELQETEEGEKALKLLKIDGKTMRGNRTANQSGLHVVTVYSDQGFSIADQAVGSKGSERTAISDLLRKIQVPGAAITIDANGTYQHIARQITEENKAFYVLPIKNNQPKLFEEVKICFSDEILISDLKAEGKYFRTEEWARSQQEIREYFHYDFQMWERASEWPKAKNLGMVKRTRVKDGVTKVEIAYFIDSLENNVIEFSKAVRGHWSIEVLHWHLDVTFREDSNKTISQTAALNMNHMRKLALSILKAIEFKKKASLKSKRFMMSMQFEKYAEVIFSI